MKKKKTKEELERDEAFKTIVRTSKAKTPEDLKNLMTTISQGLINTMLKEELTNYLGYESYDKGNKLTLNSRNGNSEKTLKSDFGNLSIVMPRDRDSSFKPIVIPKSSRMMEGMEEKILSLYAMGVTQRDICKFTEDIYGCQYSSWG